MKLTDKRKEIFLNTLARTGSVAAAVKAASPHADTERTCKSTFHDARRRDPEFAAAWDAAADEALAMIEEELVRRAMNPPRSPVTNRQGEVVGEREDRMSSDRLLLRIASRLNPDAWAERRRNDHVVSGQIEHSAHLTLAPADLMLLPKPKQEELIMLLEEIHERKESKLDPMRIQAPKGDNNE